MTLEVAFNARRNSLNFLRLALATSVIISHSWPLGGFGEDPHWGSLDLGDWAVGGFFAISGWLITASRLSTTPADFLWRRALRIYPGFLVCLLVVAFAFAPLAGLIGPGTYNVHDGASYVLGNATLWIRQWGIGDTLATVPFPDAWDGALWTLVYEFACYLAVGLIVTLVSRRHVSCAILVGLGAAMAVSAAAVWTEMPLPESLVSLSRLSSFFFAGSILYVHRARVPSSPALAVVSSAGLAVSMVTSSGAVLGALPVAYLCMWLGAVLPLTGVGRHNDLSYGMYIYAFPVQQMLVLLGAATMGVAPYIALCIACTVPLAAASWFFVERPASRLRNLMRREATGRVVREPAVTVGQVVHRGSG